MRRAATGIVLGLAIVSPFLTQRVAAEALARSLAETLDSNELELAEFHPAESTGIVRGLELPESASDSQFLPSLDQDAVAPRMWTASSHRAATSAGPLDGAPRGFPSPLARSCRVRC